MRMSSDKHDINNIPHHVRVSPMERRYEQIIITPLDTKAWKPTALQIHEGDSITILTDPSCTTALGARSQLPAASPALGSFSNPPYRLMNSVGCWALASCAPRCFRRSPSLGVSRGVPRRSDAVFFLLVPVLPGLQKEKRVHSQSSSSESRRSKLA